MRDLHDAGALLRVRVMRHRWLLISVLLVIGLGLCWGAARADPFKGPWSPATAAPAALAFETSVPRLAARGALAAWHTVLTRADGARSPMYPTASAFLGQALASHGMVIGIVMTADRLMHEWDEQQRAPRIIKFGVPRAYDPVEANDFWWASPSE